MKINLSDVIEAIEFQGDLVNHYYNRNSGIIIGVEDSNTSAYTASLVKDLDKFEEWEKELICNLYDFEENPEDYISLPKGHEVDEHRMLLGFCDSLEDSNLRDKLLNHRESLLNLKKSIEDSGLLSDWYDYREKAERNLAINWCENNNLEYIC